MLSRGYRSTARNALKGNWGISILVTLVAGILGGTGSPVFNSASSSGSSGAPDSSSIGIIPPDSIPPAVLAVFSVILSLMLLYAIVTLIVGGAVRLGLASYNIDLITRRKPLAFSALFSRFSIFGKALLLQFMISLLVFLWSLLFIIPGIIAAYRYAMAPYLMSENPELGVMETVNLSKQMMQGNKWRLFMLGLSFIGWIILGAFTFGIGYLWLAPYIYASEAAFFLDVSGRAVYRGESFTNGPGIV